MLAFMGMQTEKRQWQRKKTLELANVTSKQGSFRPVHQQQHACSYRDLFAEINRSPQVLGSNPSIDHTLAHIEHGIVATNVSQ
jgi:hypothetical protein